MKPRRDKISDVIGKFKYFAFVRYYRVFRQTDQGIVKNHFFATVNPDGYSRKVSDRGAEIFDVLCFHIKLLNKNQYNYKLKRTIMQAYK